MQYADGVNEDITIYSFREMFIREIKAASRGNHSLSLVLLSIIPENKHINILENTDSIISTFSRVVKTKLRETDVSLHYGFNKLLILLPFTGKDNVNNVIVKLHNVYDTHSVIRRKTKGLDLVASSVTYPNDGKNGDKLLQMLEENHFTIMEKIKASSKHMPDYL